MATAETANLGSESQQAGKSAGACAMVLFGAAGDLTKRKLIPALFNLVKANLLPKDFAVLGVSVDALTLEQFRTQVTGFCPQGIAELNRGSGSRSGSTTNAGSLQIPTPTPPSLLGLVLWIGSSKPRAITCFIWRPRQSFLGKLSSTWEPPICRTRRTGGGDAL